MADKQSRDQSGIEPVDPTRGGTGRTGGSLANESSGDPVDMSDIHGFLDGMEYPASSEELVDYARKRYAPFAVLDVLEQLPPSSFRSFDEVSDLLQEIEQGRLSDNG